MSLENILDIIIWGCFISAFGILCHLRGKIKGRREGYMLISRIKEDCLDQNVFGQ